MPESGSERETASDARNKKIAVWVATGFLSLAFVASGGIKLVPGTSPHEAFAGWGYPPWFVYLIGSAEVAGAVGLLVPRLAPLAAAGLVLVMGGAAVTHLKTEGEAGRALVPVAFAVLLVGVAIARVRERRAATPPT